MLNFVRTIFSEAAREERALAMRQSFERGYEALHLSGSLQERTIEDAEYPISNHVQELRDYLESALPEGRIYGSAIYAPYLNQVHHDLNFKEKDIDIGITSGDLRGFGPDNERAETYIQGLQRLLPDIQWSSLDRVNGYLLSGSSYEGIEGSFEGHWTDKSGQIHLLQFNLGKGGTVGKPDFTVGESVLTSASMLIGTGDVRVHAAHKEHVQRLLYSSTNQTTDKRVNDRFETLSKRIPELQKTESLSNVAESEGGNRKDLIKFLNELKPFGENFLSTKTSQQKSRSSLQHLLLCNLQAFNFS